MIELTVEMIEDGEVLPYLNGEARHGIPARRIKTERFGPSGS